MATTPNKLDREILVLGGVIVVGTIMAILDATIVNVAIPTLGRDFRYGDVVETAPDEEAHRLLCDLLPRSQLLGLAQAHVMIVYGLLQLQKISSPCNISPS